MSMPIFNDNTREILKVENITDRYRKARLKWFGHVKGRDQEYVGIKALEMVPPGRRNKGRLKQRFMNGLFKPRHESHRNNKR